MLKSTDLISTQEEKTNLLRDTDLKEKGVQGDDIGLVLGALKNTGATDQTDTIGETIDMIGEITTSEMIGDQGNKDLLVLRKKYILTSKRGMIRMK